MDKKIDKSNKKNEGLDEWSIESSLDGLYEEIKSDVELDVEDIPSLKDIGEFDSEWNFNFSDGIKKWCDKKWNYIIVGGNKYYDDKCRSELNKECLWYSISKLNNWVGAFCIWIFNWMNQERWREYYSNGASFEGKWENGVKSYGFERLPNGDTFEWSYSKNWQNWTFIAYDKWELRYTYEWWLDSCRNKQWRWICTYKNGEKYDWDWLNWKKHWHGEYFYWDGYSYYDWDWSNWKKHWHGIERLMTSEWERIYDWERYEWKINGKWIMTYPNLDTYEWLFINWIPFHRVFNEQQYNYTVWWDMPTKIEWTWTYTHHSNWNKHTYSVSNWALTETSNDFISMYGDHKPNEDRWAKRGTLIYSKKFESENKISYSLKSWWVGPIKWELNGWYYKFTSNSWKILSIPQTSEFWEKWSMHAANIINFCINNARENWTNEFDWKGGTLQAKQSSPHWSYLLKSDWNWSTSAWVPTLTTEYEENDIDYLKKYIRDTDILEHVQDHFGWISAEELAKRLNSCL